MNGIDSRPTKTPSWFWLFYFLHFRSRHSTHTSRCWTAIHSDRTCHDSRSSSIIFLSVNSYFFWLNGQWNVRIFFLSRINFWCMENFHVAVFFSILHPVSLFAADRWVLTARSLLWDAQNWQRQINHLPWWFSYVKNISLIVRDPTQCVMSRMDVDFSMKLNTILFHSSTWSSFLQSDDFES